MSDEADISYLVQHYVNDPEVNALVHEVERLRQQVESYKKLAFIQEGEIAKLRADELNPLRDEVAQLFAENRQLRESLLTRDGDTNE